MARVSFSVEVEVTNPERLRAYARRRFVECWGSDDGFPSDLPNQVLEALVLSNENPSPDEIGIQIGTYSAEDAS